MAGSGEILAFVDSGDVPSEPWLRQIVATFQDPLVGMASWPAWVVDAALGREQLVRTGSGPEGMVALATCFAMRRSIFDAVGGYDTELRCGENSDLCERAATYCLAVVAASSAPTRPRRASCSVVRRHITTGHDSTPRSTCSGATPTNSPSTGQSGAPPHDRRRQRGALSRVVACTHPCLGRTAARPEPPRPGEGDRHARAAPG